jgi:cardiolipin synthase A/B
MYWALESLPNDTTQKELISRINQAHNRIWIEIYTWTDAAKLTDPIIRAHARWVDVRVVLEGNVFGTPQINTSLTKKLKDAGIPAFYADNHRYTFTHAKFWIIDQTYSISTGNWTASFFNKNREYIYTDTDTTTLRFLEEIFSVDAEHMPFRDIAMIPPHVVISPLDAREKIEGLISRTQESLIIYVQTLDDPHILGIIDQLIQEGKRVEICTADNESNQARQKEFSSWHWNMIKTPYLHAKVIIRDGKEVFVGSHNLTTNAIQNNREMGLIIHDRSDIRERIESDFIWDGCRE